MRLFHCYFAAKLSVLLILANVAFADNKKSTFTLDLAPQPKQQALLELARQTKHDIIFDAGIYLSKTSDNTPALVGDYSIFDALKLLLKGTNLSYTIAEKRIRIHLLESDATTLPKVTVQGYLRDSSRIVLGDDTQANFPLYQVPLSIQSIPESYIEDVQARDATDAISLIQGVEFFETAGGTTPAYYSRGILTPFSIDGKFYRRSLIALDPSALERIDLIQGPSANYMTPGGMINFVTKKPSSKNKESWSFTAGPEDFYRSELDLNLASEGTIEHAFRFAGAYEKKADVKRFAYEEKRVIAPSYAVEFPNETQVLLSGYNLTREQFANTMTIHDSVLGYRLPEDRTLAFPWEGAYTRDSSFAADISNPDVGGWRISVGGNWNYSFIDNYTTGLLLPLCSGLTPDFLLPFCPADPNDYTEEIRVVTYFYTRGSHTKSNGLDGSMEKNFSIGDTDLLFRLGVDYQRFDIFNNFFNLSGLPFTIVDVTNPDYSSLPEPPAPPKSGDEKQLTYFRSAYTTQNWYINDYLTLLLDLRYEDMKFVRILKDLNFDSTIRLNGRYKEWTPQAGFNLEFSDVIATHLTYSESFTHQNFWDAGSLSGTEATFVPPSKNQQLEFAIKKPWNDGRLNSTLTFYHITTTDLTYGRTDLDINGDFIPDAVNFSAEDQKSKGGSLSIEGDLTQNLSIIANYNVNDNTIPLITNETVIPALLNNTQISETRQLRATAKKHGNIWLHYDSNTGTLKNYDFAVGAKYVGDRYGDDFNTFTLEEYSTTDFLFRYTGIKNIDLSMNIRNVFNKFYYRSSLGFNALVEEGERRSVYFTIKWKNFLDD